MSWKSIVSAGLLCILAVPAFAQTPTLRVIDGGLDGGNRVWLVQVGPEDESAVAVELGFAHTAGAGNILTATSNADWEDDGIAPIGNTGTNPYTMDEADGIVIGAGGANVFAALGSTDELVGGSLTQVLRITTSGPISVLDLSGIWGDGSEALVVEAPGDVTSGLGRLHIADRFGIYGDFAGQAPNNAVGDADFGEFAGLYGKAIIDQSPLEMQVVARYLDANGDGLVGDLEFGQFSGNYGFMGAAPGAGSGGLAGSVIPEPASLTMLLLAACAGLLRYRRRG